MKVSDLKNLLEQYPDDKELVYQNRSNDCISVVFEDTADFVTWLEWRGDK